MHLSNVAIRELAQSIHYKGDIDEFAHGVEDEWKEHHKTVGESLVMAAKIAMDHLNEDPHYYSKMKVLESYAGAAKAVLERRGVLPKIEKSSRKYFGDSSIEGAFRTKGKHAGQLRVFNKKTGQAEYV
jgi:hypothetical protein